MTTTIKSRSVTMTAQNDEDLRMLHIEGLVIAGTGMTAGQRLTMIEVEGGSTIVDHYIEAANENKEFFVECRKYRGVRITAAPAGGTWSVIIATR